MVIRLAELANDRDKVPSSSAHGVLGRLVAMQAPVQGRVHRPPVHGAPCIMAYGMLGMADRDQ